MDSRNQAHFIMDTFGKIWLPNAQMATTLAPLEVVATKGRSLILQDGRELIDAIASWWTACHGYNVPTIIEAIQTQAQILPHVMLGGLIHPQAQKLAHRIGALTSGSLNHVFFSESGACAIEIAMKMALQFWVNQKQSQKNRFIYFQQGYHGDTLFATSVCCPSDLMHQLFANSLPLQFCQPLPKTAEEFGLFEKWLQQHAHEAAGMLIEPLVQGAGGMKMHSKEVLHTLYQLAKKYELLFIADEIFTGFGRTGSFFACDEADIIPDIMCLSKALTGGTLPLALTVANEDVFAGFLGDSPEKAFFHSSTFMGNPIACAAANASLDIFATNQWQKQVASIEAILEEELAPLQALKGVRAVRIKGAIGAIELTRPLKQDMNWFKARAIEEGIWCRPLPSGETIYTTPSFTIEKEELLHITRVLNKLITTWSNQYFA